ncbi:hypothetical protein SLS62_009448 [Diatrype stigma]|uniref:Peptidase M20 dimerisation domain-containing protein n=1 Tax=Diatrype stigma TaxID=117547 RepID=A0AAN9UEE8_9PEZI
MKLLELSVLLLGSSRALASKLQKPIGAGVSPPTPPPPPPSSSLYSNNNAGEGDDAPPYRESLVSLHKSLIDIESISFNEYDVGRFLVDYLTERGFVTELQFLPSLNSTSITVTNNDEKPRFNVLAWPGPAAGRGKRNHHYHDHPPRPKVLVTSHIDTVPPYIPYSVSDSSDTSLGLGSDSVIAGRGSVDAKASVAAQIVAVLSLLEDAEQQVENPQDLMLLYVVGEERNGDGMRFFSDSVNSNNTTTNKNSNRGDEEEQEGEELATPLSFDFSSVQAAIFGEPTEGKLACGHKGFFGCEVRARGRAGHSGYPWLGQSATEALMRGLVAVLDADLGSSADFGNTTINVGTLAGGAAPNVIAEAASAQIAGRVAIGPEDDGGRVVAERLVDVLRAVYPEDPQAFETECRNGYGVVRCDCEVDGFETITVNYGTDVPNLKGNHTRYLYGPGSILVAHGPDEAIKLRDLERAVEDYKKLILHALKS